MYVTYIEKYVPHAHSRPLPSRFYVTQLFFGSKSQSTMNTHMISLSTTDRSKDY